MSNIINLNDFRKSVPMDELDYLIQDEEPNFLDEFMRTSMGGDEFATEITRDIVHAAVEEFGCNLHDNPKCIYDIMLIIEHIKGLVYRTTGKKHPSIDMVDALFDQIIDDPSAELKSYLETD